MEKRTCKLCFRTFSNGRALGGHMRSHMLKLQAAPTKSFHPQKTKFIDQLEDETDSASSYSSSEEDDDKGLSYGLRENPRKSFRLVDPGYVVQDTESEAESSRNPSRRRSSGLVDSSEHLGNQVHGMKMKKKSSIEAESQELISSLSGTTSEEDVALCLMMLSRGIRTRKAEVEDGEKWIEESDEELEEIKTVVKSRRSKYQCGTCKKYFRSYQALGGHRANHKKIKVCNSTPSSSSSRQTSYEQELYNAGSATVISNSTDVVVKRIHECSVCFRVFSSGQALGGHKRSHLTGSSSTLQPTINTNTNPTGFQNYLIDLNLPAPMDDEDQIELSAVSNGEFTQ